MGGEGREEESIWSCEVIFSKELVRENSGLLWNQLNCTGSGPDKDFRTWHAGPMVYSSFPPIPLLKLFYYLFINYFLLFLKNWD